MTLFAETLDQIINSRNVSNNKAATQCGLDSTLLRRYRKGERFPRSEKVISQLAEGLSLSDEEISILKESLLLSKNQQSFHKMNMEQFISSFEQFSFNRVPCDLDSFIPDVSKKMYEITKMEDLHACLSFLHQEIDSKSEIVYTLSLESQNTDLDILGLFLLPSLNHTEHIILPGLTHKNDMLLSQNMPISDHGLFSSYVHHLAFGEKGGDHSFYMCPFTPASIYNDCWFILTDKCMIKISIEESRISGFMSFDQKVIKHYRKMYDLCKLNSQYLGNNIDDVFLMLWEEWNNL